MLAALACIYPTLVAFWSSHTFSIDHPISKSFVSSSTTSIRLESSSLGPLQGPLALSCNLSETPNRLAAILLFASRHLGLGDLQIRCCTWLKMRIFFEDVAQPSYL